MREDRAHEYFVLFSKGSLLGMIFNFNIFALNRTKRTFMKKYPIYNVKNFSCNTDESEFYVNSFQSHLQLHGFVDNPHRHDSYLLVFFTKGSGIHDIDFSKFKISPGSLFVMQPGQIHHWDLSDDMQGFIVIFSKEIYRLYFEEKQINDYLFYSSVYNSPQLFFDVKEQSNLLLYFNLLLLESQNKMELRLDAMSNLLDCIHIEIARKYNQENRYVKHSYNSKISDFEVLVERYFKQEKAPSFYASQLHITLKHLNRICNEILQKTATEFIGDRVVLEAKRMLVDKNLSINEIALKLGFEDYSYFSRFFKKKTNSSPSEFRKSKK